MNKKVIIEEDEDGESLLTTVSSEKDELSQILSETSQFNESSEFDEYYKQN